MNESSRTTSKQPAFANTARVQLSPRELTVLQYLAHGKTNEQIATALFISPGTVKTHVQHILHRLDVPNRTQAVIKAAQIGLVELGEVAL